MPLDLIKNRYCLRDFSSELPSDEKIENILEAARLAPSWVNVQPWHFIVIKNQETKDLLSQLANGQPHVAAAPVVIACCGDVASWEQENYKKIVESRPGISEEKVNRLLSIPALNPELLGEKAIEIRTVEELTYAVAYMTLEAQEQGVGACIVGGFGNELTQANPEIYQQVKAKLNLPPNIYLITLLLLGYPSDSNQMLPKARKNKDEVVSYERYEG